MSSFFQSLPTWYKILTVVLLIAAAVLVVIFAPQQYGYMAIWGIFAGISAFHGLCSVGGVERRATNCIFFMLLGVIAVYGEMAFDYYNPSFGDIFDMGTFGMFVLLMSVMGICSGVGQLVGTFVVKMGKGSHSIL